MKKIIYIITIFIILATIVFTSQSFAAALDAIDIKLDKSTVRPGENVKLEIDFGKALGAYTFDIAYDNNIFEYVNVDGGTANDTSDKVRVTYYDSTGGTNPRNNMIIEFKAKDGITTSNPTEFTITAEGLANADASESYDDITSPIVKNVTVEPEYVDYTINLETSGDIIVGEENEMTLSYSSPMGHYYEHARLIGEAISPNGATVKLLGTDEANIEHDIIESGWGDAQGYKIGGKDVLQVLKVRGLFSKEGNYKITLKLIDRDNSDSIIAEKTFDFNVIPRLEVTPPTEEPIAPEQTVPGEIEESINNEINNETNNNETMPTQLPKTGYNIYMQFISLVALAVIIIYMYIRKISKEKIDKK